MYAAAKRRSSMLNPEPVQHIVEQGIIDHDENDKILTLNVSGRRFQTYESTLARFPTSLLGDIVRRKKFYKYDKREYFFDRHRPTFESILYFYQSKGIMSKPPNIPIHVFINELIYFDVGDEVILKLQLDNGLKEVEKVEAEPSNWVFKLLWDFLENPQSSKSAKYFALVSVFVIVLSLILFIIETLPEFAAKTVMVMDGGKEIKSKIPSKHESWMFFVNTAVISWFTVEFILRFICCPSKLSFFIEVGNIIDFLSILPYYIVLMLTQGGSSVAMLRVIRVLRVFKLARHSRGLQILGNTLKASFNELMMLAFFLFVMILIFGSCAYYAEYEEPGTKFKSIPASFWWAIVTMTTVGYGDMYPKTFWGQIVGSMAVVCGVLTIALPVPVVVSNFEYFYTKERNRKKTEETRKEQERQEKEIASGAAAGSNNINSGTLSRRFQNLKQKLHQLSSRNSPVESPRDARTQSPRDIDIQLYEYTPNGSLRHEPIDDEYEDGDDYGRSPHFNKKLLTPILSHENVSFVTSV